MWDRRLVESVIHAALDVATQFRRRQLFREARRLRVIEVPRAKTIIYTKTEVNRYRQYTHDAIAGKEPKTLLAGRVHTAGAQP